ncbi:MAG: group II truncated hemoglobin [Proteobacteria bacterium]|nr:group II truncated hemoglobin [Pseudomonadota bacterium]HQR02632.1 group II truncated hemoglobin [Rhodocyclaceae bacterium]
MAETDTLYHALGGATGLRRLVDHFYEIMDQRADARTIRRLHPRDLSRPAEKLFMYLSGYLGGPNLFIEKFGHPRLRARHLPFSIGIPERDQWLSCMAQALADHDTDDLLRQALMQAFSELADHMRNRPEPEETP